MDITTIIIFAIILLLVIAAVWWLRGRYDALGLSPEEAALKALDKAAAQVAKFKSPAPEAQAAIAAGAARRTALVQSIQANIAKL